MTDLAPNLAGLVDFYRNPARVAFSGDKKPQEAMDSLASDRDKVLGRRERAGMNQCAPKLNTPQDASFWTSKGSSPWPKLENEKPQAQTVADETRIDASKAGRAS